MRLLDRRLWQYGRASSWLLLTTMFLEVVRVGLLIGQALLSARIVAAAFVRGQGISALVVELVLLGTAFGLRAVVGWASGVVAQRTSAAVRSDLRLAVLRRVTERGSGWSTSARSGELATLVLRGIDALDDYVARYLPQLVLAGLVPLVVVLCLLEFDWLSALLVVLTVPLIPVFMMLVGASTRDRVGTQWVALQRLAHHFLDVVAGLGTLATFGRSRAQIDTVRRLSERQRHTGQATLRVAFLSSLILELLATLSVAIVAVVVSLRVLYGNLDFETAFFVLLLVPEAYQPMRQLATQYHANAEGMAAADRAFEVLDTADERSPAGTVPAPEPRTTPIVVDAVTVHRAGRDEPVLSELSMRIEPGRFTGIVAPTGTGKSTLLALLTGSLGPDRGSVSIGGVDLRELDLDGPAGWRRRVGWLPQAPELFCSTVAENIALGADDPSPAAVAHAARVAGVDLALGARVGERGGELSAGQRRRVALARAIVGDPGLLLLDEPTESVDPATEAAVVTALRRELAARTVVVVTHRPAVLQLCHDVVQLDRELAGNRPCLATADAAEVQR